MKYINHFFPVSLLSLLYAFLFVHFELGLNVLLYDAIFILVAGRLRPDVSGKAPFIWTSAALLFSAISVVIVNTWLSILAHGLTFIILVGYLQWRELRFIWFAFLLGLHGHLAGPFRWIRQSIRATHATGYSGRYWSRRLKQFFVPLLLMVPFVLLYGLASVQLGDFLDQISLLLVDLFSLDHLGPYLLLSVWGIIKITAALFPRVRSLRLLDFERTFTDQLVRSRQNKTDRQHATLALKTEYQQATIAFGVLNALLLLVNLLDFRFVWLPAESLSAQELSHFVHLGTYNLIISIFLAMGIVLYYFRGNLNFFPRNHLLKQLTNAWLIQNAVLAFSVAIRNHHYIRAYGLAYGRIMVLFCLMLIFFGLYTLGKKINHRLSTSYLFQSNGLAAWLALLLFASVNWGGVITRYNLATQHLEEVDWHYLSSGIGPQNTFLLAKHQEYAPFLAKYYSWKRKNRPEKYVPQDWRSWNYADYRNLQSLKNQ
ncbi:MAG: DUF4153 domain-containing protein [Bacteroidota bacterium]